MLKKRSNIFKEQNILKLTIAIDAKKDGLNMVAISMMTQPMLIRVKFLKNLKTLVERQSTA